MSPRPLAIAARRGALVVAGLVAAAMPFGTPAVAENSGESDTPMCNGRPATIVGSPGGSLLGTAGDDVIVTNGEARIDSGAGDDAICVTDKGAAVINAGTGDDFVGARSHRGRTFVSLGFRRHLPGWPRCRPGLEPGGVQPDLHRRPRRRRHRGR